MADEVLYSQQIVQAYDRAGEQLHADGLTSPYASHINELNANLARRVFPEGAFLLEVGCRTGFLTEALANAGFQVLAIDASERLLQLLRKRAEGEGWADNVQVKHLPNLNLSRLRPTRFEGAIIGHGVLNLVTSPRAFADRLANLLEPETSVLADVLNRLHIVEFAVYPLVGRFSKGFRKLGGPVPLQISRSSNLRVPTQFYHPSEIATAFTPWFATREVVGAFIAMPPPSFGKHIHKLGPALNVLGRIDDRIRRLPPFNHLGHHFILRAERIAL